jgi:hypothetical protein
MCRQTPPEFTSEAAAIIEGILAIARGPLKTRKHDAWHF